MYLYMQHAWIPYLASLSPPPPPPSSQLSSPAASVSPTHSVELPPIHDSTPSVVAPPISVSLSMEPEIDKVKPAALATDQDISSSSASSIGGSRYMYQS